MIKMCYPVNNAATSEISPAALFYLSALTNFRSKLHSLGVPLVGLTPLPTSQSEEMAAATVVAAWVKTCRAHVVITDETYEPVAMLQRTHMAKPTGRSSIQCPLYAIDSNFVVPIRHVKNRHNLVLNESAYKAVLAAALRKIFNNEAWRKRVVLQPLSKALQVRTCTRHASCMMMMQVGTPCACKLNAVCNISLS